MGRKEFVIVLSAITIIGASVFVYSSGRDAGLVDGTSQLLEKTGTGVMAREGTDAESTSSVNAGMPGTVTQPASEPAVSPELTPLAVLKNEELAVQSNSAEYDLKAYLYEAADAAVYLKLEYYLDGAAVTKEFSDRDIPEIDGIFEKRAKNGSKEDGYRIGQLLLNARYSKVYFTVIGSSSIYFSDTRIYGISLKDGSVKEIGGFYGRVVSMLLSSSGRYLAFSYINSPFDSNHIENKMLDVISCEKDKFNVRFNRDSKEEYIGSAAAPDMLYNYELKSWKTDSVILLKQISITLDGSQEKNTKTAEVLYNISKNLLLNADGTAIQPAGKGV